MTKITELIQSEGCKNYLLNYYANLYEFKGDIFYYIKGDLNAVLVLEYLNVIDICNNKVNLNHEMTQTKEYSSHNLIQAGWNHSQIVIVFRNKKIIDIVIGNSFSEFIINQNFGVSLKNGFLNLDDVIMGLNSSIFNIIDWPISLNNIHSILYYFSEIDAKFPKEFVQQTQNYVDKKWFLLNSDGSVEKNKEQNKFFDLDFFRKLLPKITWDNASISNCEWGFNFFTELSFNEKKRFIALYQLNFIKFSDIKNHRIFLKKDTSIQKFKKLHDIFCQYEDTESYDISLLNHIFKKIVKNSDKSINENIDMWIKSLKKYKEGVHVFSHYIEFISENFSKINSIDLESEYLKKLGLNLSNKKIINYNITIPFFYKNNILEITTVQGVKTAGYTYQNCLRYDNATSYILKMKKNQIRLFNLIIKDDIGLLKTNFFGMSVSELEGFGKEKVSLKIFLLAYSFVLLNIVKNFGVIAILYWIVRSIVF